MYGRLPHRPLSVRSWPFSLKTEHRPKSEILRFPEEPRVGVEELVSARKLASRIKRRASERTSAVEEQVLGLDVPMSNTFLMDELLWRPEEIASGCPGWTEGGLSESGTYDPCDELVEEEVGTVVVHSHVGHCYNDGGSCRKSRSA